MKKELQQIIDGCEHPAARRFFEKLFARHDEIIELLNDRANGNVVDEIADQYDNVVDFDQALRGWDWNDEEEQIDELDAGTLERYKDRANSQLRRGTFASKFPKPAIQAKKRANRMQGVKRASSLLNTFNNDEHANTTSEGFLGNMVRSTIAH